MRCLWLASLLCACAVDRTDCTTLPSDCIDPLTLGGAGFVTLTAPIEWTWSEPCRASIGAPIAVSLPDDIVGVGVTVDAGDEVSGIARLADDGEVRLDMTALDGPPHFEPPLWHEPAPAGSVALPIDQDTAPRPGCLQVIPMADGDRTGEADVLHVVGRAGAGGGRVDIDAVVLRGAGIDEAQVRAATQRIDAIWARAGAGRVGAVTIGELDFQDGQVDSEGEEIAALRRSWRGPEGALTVFFVQDFSDGAGTLGIASGIPGPLGVPGTAGSGLVVSVDSHLDADGDVDVALLGGTLTHELGHQLGLFHTTEENGRSWDGIDDTPQCPRRRDRNLDGKVDADECEDFDGANVMFWISTDRFVQEDLTPVQASVFARSPVMR